LLQQAGNHVTLWGHDSGHLEEVRRVGRNERYLPGVALAPELKLESELLSAVASAECVVVAVPSVAFRGVTGQLASFGGTIVSVTKGIEYQTGLTMCGILAETAPKAKCATLSGPTFAIEVARDVPTAIVAASRDQATAGAVQRLFNRPA